MLQLLFSLSFQSWGSLSTFFSDFPCFCKGFSPVLLVPLSDQLDYLLFVLQHASQDSQVILNYGQIRVQASSVEPDLCLFRLTPHLGCMLTELCKVLPYQPAPLKNSLLSEECPLGLHGGGRSLNWSLKAYLNLCIFLNSGLAHSTASCATSPQGPPALIPDS